MGADFFDAVYFGHQRGERKSNYGAIGGYKYDTGDPKGMARWVQEELEGIGWFRAKVLDIGCAIGATVQELGTLGLCAFGVDVSKYILTQAVPQVADRLYWADMYRLGESAVVQHAPFNAIISKDVLEHAYPEEIPTLLKHFSLFAPFQLHVVNTGQHKYQAYDGDVSHHTRWPLEQWEGVAETLGLQVLFRET